MNKVGRISLANFKTLYDYSNKEHMVLIRNKHIDQWNSEIDPYKYAQPVFHKMQKHLNK
jgi:hypothetical protein